MLEHFDPHHMPSTAEMLIGLPLTPTVQAIVIDVVSMVDPQSASIIRNEAESVMSRSEESHATCPSHGKVISSAVARPIATSVPIVD
jgi:hypothetical protein